MSILDIFHTLTITSVDKLNNAMCIIILALKQSWKSNILIIFYTSINVFRFRNFDDTVKDWEWICKMAEISKSFLNKQEYRTGFLIKDWHRENSNESYLTTGQASSCLTRSEVGLGFFLRILFIWRQPASNFSRPNTWVDSSLNAFERVFTPLMISYLSGVML